MRIAAAVFVFLWPSASALAQRAAPARLVEEWRYDGAENDLGVTPHAIVGPSGRIALPQPLENYVRVIDSSGRTVARLGRRGTGPGEFQGLAPFGGWLGDTLWTFDSSLQRLTLFQASGRIVRSLSLHGVRAGPRIRTMARSSSDNFHPLALWPNGSLVALRMARLDDTTTERTVVAITPRGEISEVLANVSGDPGSVVVAVPGYRASVSIPFVASLPPAASPDGRRLVLPVPGTGDRESATLFVTIVNEAGDTVAARALSFTARPIGSVARDSAIDARLNPRGGRVVGQGVNPASATPRPPGVANRIREELNARVPFVHPAVRSIHVGANYWIWLERQRDSTGSAYDVYDVNLNPLFVVHLSPKSALVHMTATHVWARELDEDDLPSIVRYRIHR